MEKICIAIAGVGNCASSLVQGLEYYKNVKKSDELMAGLMHNSLGGYLISDIKVVAAFDVDNRKVGKDLSEAIFGGLNCTTKFCDVPFQDVEVMLGPIYDSLDGNLKKVIPVDEDKDPVNVANVLKDTRADILLNYLPVGSEIASRWYAEKAIEANCGFINCIPVFIASDPIWSRKFEDAGLPIIGDDVASQVGASIVHKTLANLLVNRGCKIISTYQVNSGGNTDFLNLSTGGNRLKSKVESKTEVVRKMFDRNDVPITVIPSNYIPHLEDNKIMYLQILGEIFGNVPITIDLKLSVIDSPNSAGVVIDAIRCAKLASDRGLKGPIIAPSAYYFKHPPQTMSPFDARKAVEEFINGTTI